MLIELLNIVIILVKIINYLVIFILIYIPYDYNINKTK